jgi:hypothetical protein
VYDSIGDIQMLPIKDEDDSTPYLRQFSFTCIDRQNNRQITLTPDSCHGYRFSSHMLYASKTFEYAGETKRLFLRRVRVYQDSIVFYVYYNDKAALEPIYYFQTRDDDRVYPMADDPEKGYISPLHSLLLSYPMAEDTEVRAYFDKMEPTPRSFVKRHRLALSKYASHLPRFKWGVLLGLAYSKVTGDPYAMDMAASVVPGVFADIPLIADLSWHPELTFEYYSSEGRVNNKQTAYNQVDYHTTSLSSPQLIRYTALNLPSRVLPYIELGGQVTFNLSSSMDYFYREPVIKGKTPYAIEHQGEKPVPTATIAFVAGVGMEWQFSRHHSIYLSGRFFKELLDVGRIGAMLDASYNL